MKIRFNKTILPFLQNAVLRCGPVVLMISAFFDSSVFMVPVTTLFVLMMLIVKTSPVKYIVSITLGTIAGALAGYGIGHYILIKGDDRFTAIVQSVMDHNPGFSDLLYYKIRMLINKQGFLELASAFISPIPYGMFSISSGLCNLSLITFIITTIAGTALKFSVLGIFTAKAGQKLKAIIKSGRSHYLDMPSKIRYPEIG